MGVDSNVEVFLDGRFHVVEPPREGAITHACCSGYFGFKHGFHRTVALRMFVLRTYGCFTYCCFAYVCVAHVWLFHVLFLCVFLRCLRNRGRVRHPTKQALRGPRKRPRPQQSCLRIIVLVGGGSVGRVWRVY